MYSATETSLYEDEEVFFSDRNVHEAARLSHGLDKSLAEQFPSEPSVSEEGKSFRRYCLLYVIFASS
jgi:hypothetical protein